MKLLKMLFVFILVMSLVGCNSQQSKNSTNSFGIANTTPIISIDELRGAVWFDEDIEVYVFFTPDNCTYCEYGDCSYLFDFDIVGDKITFVPAKISGDDEALYESKENTIERFEGKKFVCTISRQGKNISFANDESNTCFISNEGYGKEDEIEFFKHD